MSPTTESEKIISPDMLHHVFFRTKQVAAMKEWYCQLLGAWPSYADEHQAFLTYDSADHRVALMDNDMFGGVGPPTAIGLDHVSFEYPALDDLLATYERLKRHGVNPYWTIDHGPTTSFYYQDPDGNAVELQISNFERDVDQWKQFMQGPEFAANPIGVNLDPEQLLAARRAGATLAELHERSYAGEFGPPETGGGPHRRRPPGAAQKEVAAGMDVM